MPDGPDSAEDNNELPVTFIYVGVGLAERRFFAEGLAGDSAALAQTARRWTRLRLPAFDVVAGLVLLTTNRCFFKQFPPAGCPVGSVDPPGAALGWHLIFGGLAAVLVVIIVGAGIVQSFIGRRKQVHQHQKSLTFRRQPRLGCGSSKRQASTYGVAAATL